MKPTTEKFSCPCCGHFTISSPTPGSWEVCPVCFWEDSIGSEDSWGADWEDDLLLAQRAYLKMGASHADWLGKVRTPLPDEMRSESWQTLAQRREEACLEVERLIRIAFDHVTLGHGVSLHQMNDMDNCMATGPEWEEHRKLDQEHHWWEISDEKLAKFGESLTFLDAAGYAFYLPAYLCLAARTLRQREALLEHYAGTAWIYVGSWEMVFGMWCTLDGDDYRQKEHYSYLNPAQRQVIARFLTVFATLGLPRDRKTAAEALAKFWGQFL